MIKFLKALRNKYLPAFTVGVLLMVGSVAHGQFGYTKINAGYSWPKGKFDSTFTAPGGCGAPTTVRGGWSGSGALYVDTCNHIFYYWSGGVWRNSTGGITTFAGLTDVTLTSPVNGQLVKYNSGQWINFTPTYIVVADTASMLSKYLRKIDTTNKWVNRVTKNAGNDSFYVWKGSAYTAIADAGSGGTIDTSNKWVNRVTKNAGNDSFYIWKGNTYTVLPDRGISTISTLQQVTDAGNLTTRRVYSDSGFLIRDATGAGSGWYRIGGTSGEDLVRISNVGGVSGVDLQASSTGVYNTIIFPDKAGTVALLGDIADSIAAHSGATDTSVIIIDTTYNPTASVNNTGDSLVEKSLLIQLNGITVTPTSDSRKTAYNIVTGVGLVNTVYSADDSTTSNRNVKIKNGTTLSIGAHDYPNQDSIVVDHTASQWSVIGDGPKQNFGFVVGKQGNVYSTFFARGYFNGTNVAGYNGIFNIDTAYGATYQDAGDLKTGIKYIGRDSTQWTDSTLVDRKYLNDRINAIPSASGKLNISDTAAMLSKYLRRSDTTVMLTPYLRSSDAATTYATISNLALKVNISDTSNMLTKYLRKFDTTAMLANYKHWLAGYLTSADISGKLNISDTASMLTQYKHWLQGYLKAADIAGKLNISDTSSMLTPYLRKADTTTMLSKYLRLSDAANTYATISNLALKVNISDTSTMLSKYLRRSDTTVMLSPYLRSNGVATNITGLPLTTGVTGVLPIANGGTNNGSLSVTAGTMYYGDGTKLIPLAPGTAAQHLTGGTTPAWKDTATGGGGSLNLSYNSGTHAVDISGGGTSAVIPLATSSANGLATTNQIIGTIGTSLDGQGLVISTGSKGFITIPYDCTITNWYLTADVSGSIVIDVKRGGTSIVGGGGNKPTLSSAISGNAAATSWTSVAVSAGDILEWNVDSASTLTNISLVLKVIK